MERDIIKSLQPLQVKDDEEITALGQRGIWVNKDEVNKWRGPIPISDYRLNEDSTPDLITKTIHDPVEYTQDISVRYLKPPTPAPHGDLVIRQENDVVRPAAPAQIIRQLAPRPRTPETMVIRERPPTAPVPLPHQLISLPGKVMDPPPRKVVIERMATLPPKPQPVLIEKWLPYEKQSRRVVYQPPTFVAGPPEKVKNTIIQWQVPNAVIKKEIRYLGIENADPQKYVAQYGSSLKDTTELPRFALDWENASKSASASEELKRDLEKVKLRVVDLVPHQSSDLVFTRDYYTMIDSSVHTSTTNIHDLVGDIDALNLIDLEKEGLSMYKNIKTDKKSDFATVYRFKSTTNLNNF